MSHAPWMLSWRADPLARPLADRHYTRQKVGAPQFVPPGRCVVLRTAAADAYWVTSWPFAQFVKHDWAGAWICSAYRNELRGRRSSDLILQAVAATRAVFGDPPALGMVTFVDPRFVRAKAHVGRCFLEAGFVYVGETKEERLPTFQLTPERMPAPWLPPRLARPTRRRVA